MNLQDGATVWLAWALVDVNAHDVCAKVTQATVVNAEGQFVRQANGHM